MNSRMGRASGGRGALTALLLAAVCFALLGAPAAQRLPDKLTEPRRSLSQVTTRGANATSTADGLAQGPALAPVAAPGPASTLDDSTLATLEDVFTIGDNQNGTSAANATAVNGTALQQQQASGNETDVTMPPVAQNGSIDAAGIAAGPATAPAASMEDGADDETLSMLENMTTADGNVTAPGDNATAPGNGTSESANGTAGPAMGVAMAPGAGPAMEDADADTMEVLENMTADGNVTALGVNATAPGNGTSGSANGTAGPAMGVAMAPGAGPAMEDADADTMEVLENMTADGNVTAPGGNATAVGNGTSGSANGTARPVVSVAMAPVAGPAVEDEDAPTMEELESEVNGTMGNGTAVNGTGMATGNTTVVNGMAPGNMTAVNGTGAGNGTMENGLGPAPAALPANATNTTAPSPPANVTALTAAQTTGSAAAPGMAPSSGDDEVARGLENMAPLPASSPPDATVNTTSMPNTTGNTGTVPRNLPSATDDPEINGVFPSSDVAQTKGMIWMTLAFVMGAIFLLG